MLRQSALVVATAGLLASLAIAAAAPYQPAHAQSGQSLVFAEHACLDYGVAPFSAVFEGCVSRAAKALDRGQPDLAYMQARWTRDARDACLSSGLSPETQGYQRCVAIQIDQRMNRKTLIRNVPPAI